ncbi:thioredoxin reductase (NADPH) [Haloechinothrix alba]|uniref:Ferredoxin--NADP reductase n=1 Tax=Haloechinothrix alba TaxID=664784 RepID=A0A238YYE4_9PSEU|nr:NAD(P)/FAD-dependent oxidoreductase [Haloechinothrix alba]SNR75694.1 thioredoxin reductase (NADPH) [Haloechinothrix alba]
MKPDPFDVGTVLETGLDPTAIETDVAIVGAGPCGLYAAYYAGFRGLSVTIIDALSQPGGQMAALYPEKQVYDVAGFPAVKAQDLVDALVEQAAQAKPQYLLGHTALTAKECQDVVTLTTDRGTTITAGGVVIAGGIGRFTPRVLPSGSEYEGRGLRYFVPELSDLAGADVLVVGGGDSAVDWALSLEPLARSVTLAHRRHRFRAHERSVDLLRASSVGVLTPFEVHEVHGDPTIEEVELVNVETGHTEVLATTAVVAALGFLADLGPVLTWGLELRNRQISVDRSMSTNLRRVFAAGDIAEYAGNVNLISVGFGEAALAINNLAPLVRSELPVVPGHSSDAA